MAKQTYIIKAPASVVRVDSRFILCAYSPYLYASDYDFAVVQFSTKKEAREAFRDIASPCGETFYKDNENGATYIRIEAHGRTKAEEFQSFANMITPYN